jgi:DNA-binding Lrp family transcriptional regulator
LQSGLAEPQTDAAKLVDELSLGIIEELLRNPAATYKEISEVLHCDQRTVARRIAELQSSGILKPSVEIDWRAMGLEVTAYVGLTTARTPKASDLLQSYIKDDPRIVEGYETLGSNQFFIRAIGKDIFSLRDTILRDLDPLAGDLTTSLVVSVIKPRDYFSLVRYLRETKFPRTRPSSH